MEAAQRLLRLGPKKGSPSFSGMNRKDELASRAVTRVVVCVAAACIAFGTAISAVDASPNARPTLSKIVLTGLQVGTGFQLKMRSDSHCVARCVTLDMCGFTFRSEALRTGRLQVNYVIGGKPKLSNEVVSYRPGGAVAAMREVARAVSTCPKTPVGSTVRGVGPMTYRITKLTHPGLLPGYVALHLYTSGTYNGKPFAGTSFAIFQARGNFLSGVYTEPGTGSVAYQMRLAFHAAVESAANLSREVR